MRQHLTVHNTVAARPHCSTHSPTEAMEGVEAKSPTRLHADSVATAAAWPDRLRVHAPERGPSFHFEGAVTWRPVRPKWGMPGGAGRASPLPTWPFGVVLTPAAAVAADQPPSAHGATCRSFHAAPVGLAPLGDSRLPPTPPPVPALLPALRSVRQGRRSGSPAGLFGVTERATCNARGAPVLNHPAMAVVTDTLPRRQRSGRRRGGGRGPNAAPITAVQARTARTPKRLATLSSPSPHLERRTTLLPPLAPPGCRSWRARLSPLPDASCVEHLHRVLPLSLSFGAPSCWPYRAPTLAPSHPP